MTCSDVIPVRFKPMAVGALLKEFRTGFNVDDGQASSAQLASNRLSVLNGDLLVSIANR